MPENNHEERKAEMLDASMHMMEMVEASRHGLDLIENANWGDMTQEEWDSIKQHARVIRAVVNIFGMSISVSTDFLDDNRAMDAIVDAMDDRKEICTCVPDVHFKGTRATCPQ